MASLSLTPSIGPVITATATVSDRSFLPSFKNNRPIAAANPKNRRSSISCSADDDIQSPRLDRRNMLLGLGGLYGVSGLVSDQVAAAAPIPSPDLSKCKNPADDLPKVLPKGAVTNCCPPYTDKINVFDLPKSSPECLRVRPAAHLATKEYIKKYEQALTMMKNLPDDDPRSFLQQAKIHCAYCNGAYNQPGFGELNIQVHNNWLFFPFHRWYLYFFEKILGSLIGDPNFAIPFWNWDNPAGMQMPAMFTGNPSSSLYDANRSKLHQPPYILNLDYDYKNPSDPNNALKPDEQQISENLSTMYRQMVSGAKIPILFFGSRFVAGDSEVNISPGTVETTHNGIHVLSGSEKDEDHPNGEDMGNFYSSGFDPMFYALHGNVDRLWNIWKSFGGKRADITEPDWLNASFLFYDENKKLVKVTVKDSLDNSLLGYTYQDVTLPWLYTKPTSRKSTTKKGTGNRSPASTASFPLTLKNSPVTVVVKRPKRGRKKEEKEEKEEVLVVQGIAFDGQNAVKFDVYVDDEDDVAGTTPNDSEFAGSFSNVPHKSGMAMPLKVSLRLGITDLLDDIGADDDDSIAVTLVPRTGDSITIDGIKIELLS